MITDIKNME